MHTIYSNNTYSCLVVALALLEIDHSEIGSLLEVFVGVESLLGLLVELLQIPDGRTLIEKIGEGILGEITYGRPQWVALHLCLSSLVAHSRASGSTDESVTRGSRGQ